MRSRGTPVLLEMRQLLLLLEEGNKVKFCSSVQRNREGKRSSYRGGEQRQGKGLNSCGYTSLDTLSFSEKLESYSSTVVLFSLLGSFSCLSEINFLR